MRVVLLILASRPVANVHVEVERVRQAAAVDAIVSIDAPTYGHALKRDLARAADQGYTHAIVFDLARHTLVDLPKFIEAIQRHPSSIISGVRPHRHGGMRLTTRIARAFCDLWTWGESRRWIHDSPFGYRAYPLAICSDLVLRAEKTEIDIEILVKSIWAGVEVEQVWLDPHALDAPGMLSLPEIIRFGNQSLVLLTYRLLLPRPLLETVHRKGEAHLGLFRHIWTFMRDAISHHSTYPSRFSASVGLGVFFGIVPLWGVQMYTAAVVAHLLGLSKALVVTASNISFPVTMPFIIYASVLTGHVLLTGDMKDFPPLREVTPSVLLNSLWEYVIGAVVLAVAAGALAFVLTYASVTALRIARHEWRRGAATR